MAKVYDIAKLLTLSTAHIKEDTNTFLYCQCRNPKKHDIIIFTKGEYGYFIYIDETVKEQALNGDDTLPEDLRACIKFATEKECEWLCLDRDAEPIDELPEYEW